MIIYSILVLYFLVSKNDKFGAIEYFNKVANEFYLIGKHKISLSFYLKTYDIDKRNFEALIKIGDIYALLGDYNSAIDAYNKILKINDKEIDRGKKFRFGHRHALEGSDLIVWVKAESTKPVQITLSPVED